MTMLANRKPPVKPRSKPQRFIRLVVRQADDGRNGIVRITVGKAAQDYFVSRIPADFGTAYCLEKVGDEEGTAYQVNLSADARLCDCKGYCRHHHCKHGDGLAALLAAGKLK